MHPSRWLRWPAALAGFALCFFALSAAADPPARVARLSVVAGSVSFSPGTEPDNWVQALVNRPMFPSPPVFLRVSTLWSINDIVAVRRAASTVCSCLLAVGRNDARLARFVSLDSTREFCGLAL